jgi:hypothetical protein
MKALWYRWLFVLVGLTLVVSLPVLGHWARHSSAERCALDGSRINPIYRVIAVDKQGVSHSFCCPHCAQIWLQRQTAAPSVVTVTDENTGRDIDAQAAWYVRSPVITTPTTGNRVHSFATQSAAKNHVATVGGILLPEAEKPFSAYQKER